MTYHLDNWSAKTSKPRVDMEEEEHSPNQKSKLLVHHIADLAMACWAHNAKSIEDVSDETPLLRAAERRRRRSSIAIVV